MYAKFPLLSHLLFWFSLEHFFHSMRSDFPPFLLNLENALDPVTPPTRPPQPPTSFACKHSAGHTLHQLFGGSSTPPPFPGSNRAANELWGAVPAAFCLHTLFQNKQLQPSAGATGSQIKGSPGCATGWAVWPHRQGNPCNLSCLFLHQGEFKLIFL